MSKFEFNPLTSKLDLVGSGGGKTSPLTTKGDVYTYSTTDDRIGVGADGTVLSADSTQATGLNWIAAGGTGTVTSVAALSLGTTGTDLSSTVANGTTTPVITLQVPTASASNRGVLSSTDWSTFNGKASLVSPSFTTPTLGVATATRLGIGVAADAATPLYVSGDVTGGVSLFERTNAATNAVLGTMKVKATSTGNMTDGFGSAFQFYIQDISAVENYIADIRAIRNGTDDTGKLVLALSVAGTTSNYLDLTSTALSSSTNNVLALGTTTLGWSDIFLASGGVLNWANGNATLTHSTGLLTSNVPLALGANNLTMTGSLGATGARLTKVWTAALESTALPTINGGTLATALSLSGTNTGDSASIPIGYLDTDGTLAGNSDVKVSSQKAVKTYVDQLALGLVPKPSAHAATTTTLPTNTYNNGASGVGATLTAITVGVLTVDGIALALNDYVLVKNETLGYTNGLYVVTTAGAVGVAYILTRDVTMNQSTEFSNSLIVVEAGTTNTGTLWLCTNNSSITVGTTVVTFQNIPTAGAPVAGTGISVSGTTVSIDTTVTVDKTTTQTLTNKTLTSPKINEAVALTSTATELNILDGATLTTTELNYVDGVTSAIQTQLNAKGAGTVTGTGTTNELSYWTSASAQGTLAVATYPSLTELSYVKGVTSAIQTQLGGKAASGVNNDITSLTGLTTDLPVSEGGTGASTAVAARTNLAVGQAVNWAVETVASSAPASPTTGDIWLDTSTSIAAPGTAGNISTSDGTNWTSAAPVVQPTVTKIIIATRDGVGASADVSYTGVGFMPSSISAISYTAGTVYTSEGMSDSSKTSICKYMYGANLWQGSTSLLSYTDQNNWAQYCIVKSYDADGFTLTWTKVGSPTAGTASLKFICFK